MAGVLLGELNLSYNRGQVMVDSKFVYLMHTNNIKKCWHGFGRRIIFLIKIDFMIILFFHISL